MDLKFMEKPTAKQTQKCTEAQNPDCPWKSQITLSLKCNSNRYSCMVKYYSRQGYRYCALKKYFVSGRCTDY